MKNAHLVHKNDEWKLQTGRDRRTIKTFDTKEEGMDFSTKYMRKHGGSLKVHKLYCLREGIADLEPHRK